MLFYKAPKKLLNNALRESFAVDFLCFVIDVSRKNILVCSFDVDVRVDSPAVCIVLEPAHPFNHFFNNGTPKVYVYVCVGQTFE